MKYTGRVVAMSIMAARLVAWLVVFSAYHTGYMIKFLFLFIPETGIAWWIGHLYDKSKFYSQRDILTGVYNRHFTDAMFPMLIAKAERTGQRLCLFMVDVDRLKSINDGYGHKVGDALIKVIADALLKSTRKSDFVSRWGGDEFLVVALDADHNGAAVVADRVKKSVSQAGHTLPISPSVSIGRALYPDDGRTLDALIDVADGNMYQDKRRTAVGP